MNKFPIVYKDPSHVVSGAPSTCIKVYVWSKLGSRKSLLSSVRLRSHLIFCLAGSSCTDLRAMDATTLNVNYGVLVLTILCILQSLHAYESDDFALMEVQVD
jgi:hypothetical protein